LVAIHHNRKYRLRCDELPASELILSGTKVKTQATDSTHDCRFCQTSFTAGAESITEAKIKEIRTDVE